MAARVKFFTRVTKSKAGTSKDANIRVRFASGRKFDVTAVTGKQINPKYWNNKSGSYRELAEFVEYEEKQKKLNDLKSFILKEFDNLLDKKNINNAWLNETIDKFSNPNKYIQGDTSLFGFIQQFIDTSETRINTETGNPISYKMRREYQVTFNYLKEYAATYGEPDFIDIDLEFYQQFVDFLRQYKIKRKDGTEVSLAINTIGKKIQTLKIFLNAATEHGVNNFKKYKSRNFKSLTEESDNIYLTNKELRQFYDHDLSSMPYLEKVRDLFIVGSYTGVRFSDLQQISPDKIKGDFIYLKQKKTGGKVIIPVHPTVRKILKKYNGELPKPISNQKYNEYLKKAAKKAKINSIFIKTISYNGMKTERKHAKHELISSHAARRSFCTNAYKDGIPTIAIMAISGHKTEKAFLKYIKADGEDHAKKVLDMWQNNGEFLKAENKIS